MMAGCLALIAGWEPELENFFIKRNTSELQLLQADFCAGSMVGNEDMYESVTRACKGVNIEEGIPSSDMHSVNKDGMRIDLSFKDTDDDDQDPSDEISPE